jgi:hypothetical protein
MAAWPMPMGAGDRRGSATAPSAGAGTAAGTVVVVVVLVGAVAGGLVGVTAVATGSRGRFPTS